MNKLFSVFFPLIIFPLLIAAFFAKGQVLSVTLSANPGSGEAPLRNVGLNARVEGLSGNVDYLYAFDCTSDGTLELEMSHKAATYNAADLCSYTSEGVYVAKVSVSYTAKNQSGTLTSTSTITVGAKATTTPEIATSTKDKEKKSAKSSEKLSVQRGGRVTHQKAKGGHIAVRVPANAFVRAEKATSTVVIEELEKGHAQWEDPPLGFSYVGDAITDIIVATEDGESITQFETPLVIEFGYTDNDISQGTDESALKIGYFDAVDTWQELSTAVDAVNNLATATTTHLTRFALVVSAGAVPPPASVAIFSPPAPPRTSFFVWELKGGELVQLKPECVGKADLNFDNRVNLIDFSVLSFWFRQRLYPLQLDVNKDQKLSVADFSILIYCWTR